LSFSISCNSFVFAISEIYFLHRLTKSKKVAEAQKSFLMERAATNHITSISEATKSRSTEHNVSLPKLQKVVPKGAQCKFSAQKSFQRECRAKYRRNIRRRSSKDVPKGMQNLQRKVSADTPKNKR
jgi:hypothetical protein